MRGSRVKRLIINVDGAPLRKLLSGEWNPEQVIHTLEDTTEQRASWHAKSYLEESDGQPAYPRVLLLDPEDPANPYTTKLYSQEWLYETAYAYRLPCGNWLHCENPKGPVTVHYAAPGKHPGRVGPALCAFCRLKVGPTQRHRDGLAERNRDQKDELAEARGAARGMRESAAQDSSTEGVDTSR